MTTPGGGSTYGRRPPANGGAPGPTPRFGPDPRSGPGKRSTREVEETVAVGRPDVEATTTLRPTAAPPGQAPTAPPPGPTPGGAPPPDPRRRAPAAPDAPKRMSTTTVAWVVGGVAVVVIALAVLVAVVLSRPPQVPPLRSAAAPPPPAFTGETTVLPGPPAPAAPVAAVGSAACPTEAGAMLPEPTSAVVIAHSSRRRVAVCAGAAGRLYLVAVADATREARGLPATTAPGGWAASAPDVTYTLTPRTLTVARGSDTTTGPLTDGW